MPPIPMTTYQPTPFLSEILEGSVIPEGKLAYFRARLSNRLHELVLSTFLKVEKRDQFSRADLAKRIGRKPEQITRWFASPGNWELDTVSDLLLGMGFEPALSIVNLKDATTRKPVEKVELPNAPVIAPAAGIPAANDKPSRQSFGLLGSRSTQQAASAQV